MFFFYDSKNVLTLLGTAGAVVEQLTIALRVPGSVPHDTGEISSVGQGFLSYSNLNVFPLLNRIYSEVYHAKSSYGGNIQEQFLPVRQPQEIQEFLEGFYKETGVSPCDVEYIEASASGEFISLYQWCLQHLF